MPDAPAATAVLSTTRTSSPAAARCHAVERPCTPAPMTRYGIDDGTVSGTSSPFGFALCAKVLHQAHGGKRWARDTSRGQRSLIEYGQICPPRRGLRMSTAVDGSK